jgi:hypothetical protein
LDWSAATGHAGGGFFGSPLLVIFEAVIQPQMDGMHADEKDPDLDG